MQARLIATLDELDASRNAHQLELKAERCAKEKLSEKLDRYLNEVKRADGERDEMREVVSILVEKGVCYSSEVGSKRGPNIPSAHIRTLRLSVVEACNDYAALPYARMSLARPLGRFMLQHIHPI